MFVLDLTPPAVPASSPLHRLKLEPLMAQLFPPSAVTVLLPSAKSLDLEMITGTERALGHPDCLCTSGAVHLAMPVIALMGQ